MLGGAVYRLQTLLTGHFSIYIFGGAIYITSDNPDPDAKIVLVRREGMFIDS